MPIMVTPAERPEPDPRLRGSRAKPAPKAHKGKRPVSSTPYVSPAAFPHLLADDVDDTYRGLRSYHLVEALVAHRYRMSRIAAEWKHLPHQDTLFHGKSSNDIANAFAAYVHKHPHAIALLAASTTSQFAAGTKTGPRLHGFAPLRVDAVAMASPATDPGDIYSWATLLRSVSFARTLYAIVWIVLGLLLLFFGYASICWFSNASISRKSGIKLKGAKAAPVDDEDDDATVTGSPKVDDVESQQHKGFRHKFLSGGIGGMAVGFLFVSGLITIIHNAACIDAGRKPVSDQVFFAIWALSGLLGVLLGGYFAWLSRAMAGLLAATCLTVTLTAMFGIKMLLARAVLICVLALLMTTPLLLPRHPLIRMIVLMACTSLIGVVTFLNGIAVVAPAKDPAGNWLDLWTLLFMKKDATAHDALTSAWATSVFKAFIAAAVLGTIVGFLFQFLFHRKSGHDPDSEWNDYLGTYTDRLEAQQNVEEHEKGERVSKVLSREPRNDMERAARAGLFEKAPSPWQRLTGFFDPQSFKAQPAQYGHLTGDGDGTPASPRDDAKYGSLRGQMRRKRDARRGIVDASDAEGSNISARPARFEPLSKTEQKAETRASRQKMLSAKDDDSDTDDEKTAVGSSHSDKGSKTPAKAAYTPTAARHVPVTPSLLGALDRIQRAQQSAQAKR